MMDKTYKIDIEDIANKPLLDATNPQILTPNYILDNKHLTIKISLSTLDKILSSTIFCFLIACCWRGTSGIIDVYGHYFPYLESLILSVSIFLVMALTQRYFHNIAFQSKCLTFALAKTYFFIGYIATILHFRSLWAYYDVVDEEFYEFGARWYVPRSTCSVALLIIASTCLAGIRGVVNLNTSPMSINADVKEEDFVVDFAFFKMGEKTFLYILDCIFSILIVGTLVVFVWRGSWLLIDIFLFPDDFTLSSWSSLALGYAIVATAFLLQPIMRYICERLTGTARLLVADIFIIFALFGTVNVWRGIWNLLDIYFLPDNRELSCWICHWVSLIILVLCRCSNSLLIRGVYIDAEEPEGKCVIFPCYYLRILFGKKKLEKLNLDAEAMKIHAKENEATSNKINTISNTVEENPTKEPK